MPLTNPPAVLVFAGTDPTGGAGLQADVLTLAALGCHPLSVVTAVTIQDTVGVDDYLPLETEWVIDQARSVLEDMHVAAIKIGMIGSVETVTGIAEVVSDYPDIPLILDPVLASGRGDPLANEELIEAVRGLLLPQATLITPNSIEARRLAEDLDEENDDPDLQECARRLIDQGAEFVLITGAHEQGVQVTNTLYNTRGVVHRLNWDRLPGSYHGSGCTLASAIAGLMALGQDVAEAAREAQEYTWQTLKHGFRPGMGQYIPDRLYWVRDDTDES
jgi:hydroxymethylpyrimidine/phosphomethylpyrimidine kinase